MTIKVTPLRLRADRAWAARLMAASEPWLTLGRRYPDLLRLLENPAKDCFLIRAAGVRAGFLILDLNGPLGGYLQTIGVAPGMRGRGVGTAALSWAEGHVFKSQRNLLLCVSSFNHRAAALYRRLGYQQVGRLRDYVVAGHDEILLRKTLGPLSSVEGPALHSASSGPRAHRGAAGPRPIRRRARQKSTRPSEGDVIQ